MSVKPIPESYESIIPNLICQNGDKVIDFMKKAFDAKKGYFKSSAFITVTAFPCNKTRFSCTSTFISPPRLEA